jgi:2-oxoglutarate ferredoxin oxidoreductase subunit delta
VDLFPVGWQFRKKLQACTAQKFIRRVTLAGRIEIDKERCKGCHICVLFCPRKCIVVAEELNRKGYQPVEFQKDSQTQEVKKGCTGCAICALVCPEIAIEVYRDR